VIGGVLGCGKITMNRELRGQSTFVCNCLADRRKGVSGEENATLSRSYEGLPGPRAKVSVLSTQVPDVVGYRTIQQRLQTLGRSCTPSIALEDF
jgi:hypothetical protein